MRKLAKTSLILAALILTGLSSYHLGVNTEANRLMAVALKRETPLPKFDTPAEQEQVFHYLKHSFALKQDF